MTKLITLLALIAAMSAYSQGTVNFDNGHIVYIDSTYGQRLKISKIRYGPINYPMGVASVDGSVSLPAGGYTFGINARAALYGGPVGTDPSLMTQISPVVGFLSGYQAGLLDVSGGAVATISSFAPGTQMWVQLRAWDTGDSCSSYEDAVPVAHPAYFGASQVLQVTLGSDANTAAYLVDENTGSPMPAFQLTPNLAWENLTIPEPSITVLGLLGATAAMIVCRRRK